MALSRRFESRVKRSVAAEVVHSLHSLQRYQRYHCNRSHESHDSRVSTGISILGNRVRLLSLTLLRTSTPLHTALHTTICTTAPLIALQARHSITISPIVTHCDPVWHSVAHYLLALKALAFLPVALVTTSATLLSSVVRTVIIRIIYTWIQES